jgi:glycosyltransferase involved in cell wall biosynthesis
VISFVVPAHNEEQLIGRTLGALHAAAGTVGEPYEVVVADDASTDRTAAVAREHGARVVSVRHRQIAATRNAGAREALGDVLIFVDADTVIAAAVLRAALRALRRGALGGGCLFRFDDPVPVYGRALQRFFAVICRLTGLVGGCFLFCRRDVFRAVGGFREEFFAAEEWAFAEGLKRRGRFVVLPEFVTTSGRKVRAHSAREVAVTLARLALRGPKGFRRREGLELWYGRRPADSAV